MKDTREVKPQPKVMACRCVAVGDITVKSAAQSKKVTPRLLGRDAPMHLRTVGAEGQDRMYGKGMRLHNPRVAKGKHVGYTCTVCGEGKMA